MAPSISRYDDPSLGLAPLAHRTPGPRRGWGAARCSGLAAFFPWLLRSASAQPVDNGVLRQDLCAAARLGERLPPLRFFILLPRGVQRGDGSSVVYRRGGGHGASPPSPCQAL